MINWHYNPDTVKHVLALDDITLVNEISLHQVLHWGVTDILSQEEKESLISKLATAKVLKNPLVDYAYGRLLRMHNKAYLPTTALGLPAPELQLEELLQLDTPTTRTIAGYKYSDGYGIVKDMAKAFRLFQSAEGYALAHYYLGDCYHYGKGIHKQLKMAIQHYLLAAEQDLAVAQLVLADCYRHGLGVARDPQSGLFWLEKAVKQRLPDAQMYLGRLLLAEPSTTPRGFALLQDAAERGNADAQLALGKYYHFEHYGNKDQVKALDWFKRAADQDLPEAALFVFVYLRTDSETPLSAESTLEWIKRFLKDNFYCGLNLIARTEEYLATCQPDEYAYSRRALDFYQDAIERGDDKNDLDAFWKKQLMGEAAFTRFKELRPHMKIPTPYLLEWLTNQVDWLCEKQEWESIGFLLQNDPYLRSLTIQRGKLVQGEFERTIAKPLQANDTIEGFVIVSDLLSEHFVPVLERLAASHPSLLHLEIHSSQIPPGHQQGLDRLLEEKRPLLPLYQTLKQRLQGHLSLPPEEQKTEALLSLRVQLLSLANKGIAIDHLVSPLYKLLTQIIIFNNDTQLLESLIFDLEDEQNQSRFKAILATLEQAVQQGASNQLLNLFWQKVIERFENNLLAMSNNLADIPAYPLVRWSATRQRWAEITEALQPDRKCQTLVLTEGNIDDASLNKHILTPLEKNDIIEALVIASDRLTPAIIPTLERLALSHPSLTHIECSGKQLPSDCQTRIQQGLAPKQTAKAHYKVARQAYWQWKQAKHSRKNIDVLVLAESHIIECVKAKLNMPTLPQAILEGFIKLAEKIQDIATLERLHADYLLLEYRQECLLQLLQAIARNSMAQAELGLGHSVTAYAYFTALKCLTPDAALVADYDRACDLILCDVTGIGLLGSDNKLELSDQPSAIQAKAREFLQAVLDLLVKRNLSSFDQAKTEIVKLLTSLAPLAIPQPSQRDEMAISPQQAQSSLFQSANSDSSQHEQTMSAAVTSQLKR